MKGLITIRKFLMAVCAVKLKHILFQQGDLEL